MQASAESTQGAGEGTAEQTPFGNCGAAGYTSVFFQIPELYCFQGQNHSDQGIVACFPLSQRNNTKHVRFLATFRKREPEGGVTQPVALNRALVQAPGDGSLCCSASSCYSHNPQPSKILFYRNCQNSQSLLL